MSAPYANEARAGGRGAHVAASDVIGADWSKRTAAGRHARNTLERRRKGYALSVDALCGVPPVETTPPVDWSARSKAVRLDCASRWRRRLIKSRRETKTRSSFFIHTLMNADRLDVFSFFSFIMSPFFLLSKPFILMTQETRDESFRVLMAFIILQMTNLFFFSFHFLLRLIKSDEAIFRCESKNSFNELAG